MTKARKDLQTIIKIVKRAEEMSLLEFDTMSLVMDLKHVHVKHNLKLDELLKADNVNFTHDIIGIQNNFNRKTYKLENYFLPRYI